MIERPEECEAEALRARIFEQTRVRLAIGLEPGEERRTEQRLNRLQSECGCAQTAAVFLLTFVPALVLIWNARPTGSSTAAAIVASALAFLCCMTLGLVAKLTTIWLARQRYRRALLELARELRDERSAPNLRQLRLGGESPAR